ncbi:hypothetical protein IMG5_122330, partial [Ichthyophthirius multifiliis]
EEVLINEDLNNFQNSSQIKVVGRISCLEKGFSNETNLILEIDSKNYFHLNFENEYFKQENIFIFPNQILMLEGFLENNRKYLNVTEVHPYIWKNITFQENQEQIFDNYRKIIISTGPFSPKSTFNFNAFDLLLKKAKEIKVSALILLGPFLDIENQVVKTSDLGADLSFEQLQNSLFERAATSLGPNVQIIVIPSTKDVLSFENIPQQPLEIQISSNYQQNIKSFSNPAYFEMDELSFYIGNSDIALNTYMGSFSKNKKNQNPIQQIPNVFESIFSQKNLYSMYPFLDQKDPKKITENINLEKIGNFDVNFDVENEDFPKIVISPSNLPCFAQKINDTVVINPGYVIKQETKGNFAVLTHFECNNNIRISQKIKIDFYTL